MLIIEAIGDTIFKKYAFLHPKAHFEGFFPHPESPTQNNQEKGKKYVFTHFCYVQIVPRTWPGSFYVK